MAEATNRESTQDSEAGMDSADEQEAMVAECAANVIEINPEQGMHAGRDGSAAAELGKRNRELELLYRAAQAFNSTLELDQVLATVLEKVRLLLDAGACSVWLLDRESNELVGRQAAGFRRDIIPGWRLPLGEGIAGWVAQSGESTIVSDTRSDERHLPDIDQRTQLEFRSILNVALKAKQRVVGVLQVLDAKPDRFGEADLALLEPLAASAAIAIENAQLYEETERLRAFNDDIVQSMQEGILLQDAAGRIAFANPSVMNLLGYSAEELTGLNCEEIVAPESKAEVESQMSGLSAWATSRFEVTLVAKGGHRVPVLASARPLTGSDRFHGVLCVLTDITERKQAEEALRMQNKQLATLDAIAATINQALDLDRILYATLDKVLEMVRMDAGWVQLIASDTGSESLTLAAHRGIPEPMIQSLKAVRLGAGLLGRVIRSREPAVLSGDTSDSDLYRWGLEREGEWTWVAIPIQARETILGVLNVLSRGPRELALDSIQTLIAIGHQMGMAVENLRLLREASELEILREVDRLRSELVANVSHELRTPLGLIKVFCTTLLREDVEFDRKTQREFLRDIEVETDRLEEIVGNLLDVSRIEGGRLRLDIQPTDLCQLAREVAGEMETQLEGQQIVHDFPDEPFVARVDSKRIAQVLRNLLSNAIKYSPEGGTITVRGRRQDGLVRVQVQDQGIGIPERDLERVFERFYRVDNEITRKIGGVGLGLAVCRGIVEAHSGRIWAESALGAGSVFSFILPVGSALGS